MTLHIKKNELLAGDPAGLYSVCLYKHDYSAIFRWIQR